MRTIKFRDAIEALRRNGLRKIEGSYFGYKMSGETNYEQFKDKLIEACSIGQIAKNLHDDFGTSMSPILIGMALQIIPSSDEGTLEDEIINANDDLEANLSFSEMATWLETEYREYLDTDIMVERWDGWVVAGANHE
jgi:hypothetical protein